MKHKLTDSGKWVATLLSACLCGYLMYLTEGKHGIGWFVFSLVVVWS